MVKNPPANARDAGSIPGSGRYPGEGNGNPLQYSCLENLTDRGAWWAIVHGIPNRWTWMSTAASGADRTHLMERITKNTGIRRNTNLAYTDPTPQHNSHSGVHTSTSLLIIGKSTSRGQLREQCLFSFWTDPFFFHCPMYLICWSSFMVT